MSPTRWICSLFLAFSAILPPLYAIQLMETDYTEEIGSANNYFGINLYKKISNKRKNVFFSPLSISSALSMLYIRARGNTEEEMREVLGLKYAKVQQNVLPQAFQKTVRGITENQGGYTFTVANKFLVRSDLHVDSTSKSELKKYSGIEVEEVDFANQGNEIVNKVNSWVSKMTNDKITNLLDSLNPHEALLLLNAVYFKGSWKYKFDESATGGDTFYNSGVKKSIVPMMFVKSDGFSIASSQPLDSQLLELPYSGSNLSMVIILPKDRQGMSRLEENLNADTLKDALKNLHGTLQEVKLKFPKFKLQENYELKDLLQDMGMKNAFTTNADFAGITETPVFVSRVTHKTYVEVNEEGTEAAASTAIYTELMATPPLHFTVDHPFIFLIRERFTGLIIFMGKIDEL